MCRPTSSATAPSRCRRWSRFAYLIKQQAARDALVQAGRRCGCWAWPLLASGRSPSAQRRRWPRRRQLLGGATAGLGVHRRWHPAGRRRIACAHCPTSSVLDDVMYKAIAVGFAFFTIATILGAFWAAEAWGGYWSWDPKETWALIVWLNYAAWLHMRLMKGLRGARVGLVGAGRAGGDHLRLPGREHVPVRPALLRRALRCRGYSDRHAVRTPQRRGRSRQPAPQRRCRRARVPDRRPP